MNIHGCPKCVIVFSSFMEWKVYLTIIMKIERSESCDNAWCIIGAMSAETEKRRNIRVKIFKTSNSAGIFGVIWMLKLVGPVGNHFSAVRGERKKNLSDAIIRTKMWKNLHYSYCCLVIHIHHATLNNWNRLSKRFANTKKFQLADNFSTTIKFVLFGISIPINQLQ